jgi:hypothetical protein
MKQADKVFIPHYRKAIFGVPCKDPERDKEYMRRNEVTGQNECLICDMDFEGTLPWKHGRIGRTDETHYDATQMLLMKVRQELREKVRHVVTYYDCWEEDYPGYVIEWFGIEEGEFEDLNSYPYHRLVIGENPRLLVPILRERICYIPSMRDIPVYMEILNYGFDYDMKLCGLDPRVDMTLLDLRPMIKARDIYFNRPWMGLPLHNRKLWDRWKEFVRAAETLGSKGEKFTIPNLCKYYKSDQEYKSTDIFDDFLKAIEEEEVDGEELSKEAEKRIRMAYNLALHDKGIFVKPSHGGARNIKVANQPEDIKRALGKRYLELKDSLTSVKQDAKAAAEYLGSEWRNRILSNYPILKNHPDLVEEIDPHKVPSDPDASDREMAPWEIAFEIAARETIPDYTHRSVSGETLKKHAIFPGKENE